MMIAKSKTRKKVVRKSRKKSLRATVEPDSLYGGFRLVYMPPSQAGVRVDHENALQLSSVWACVRCISQTIASMSWHVLRRRDSGDGNDFMPKHEVDWILHRQANPEMNAFSFRETMLAWALTWGNGYAEIERDQAGRPLWLWPIAPNRVEVTRDDNGRLVYEVSNYYEAPTILYAENVFHLKGLGYDGIIGYSVISMAAQSIGLGLATEQFGASFFGNGSRPGGVLEYPGRLKKEARDNLRDSWERLHGGGPKGSHRTAILEEGVKWQSIGIPPNDSQFLESRVFQVNEIARWYGVPLHKIQSLEHATFCVPGDASVFCEGGPKRADAVRLGERVWSRSDSGQWLLRKVNASACSGVDEIITIKTGLRTLRCTAAHRLPVRRQILKPFAGGGGRSILLDGKKYRRHWEVVQIRADEIKCGDQLLAASGFGDSGKRLCPTRIPTESFMESLGLIVGDGFFARGRSMVTASFGISHGEKDSYLPHYIESIESEFLACDGPYGLKNGGTTALKAKVRDKNTTVFHSSLACRELATCGISGTAKTKKLPEWIFGIADNLKLAFLRGYLDSDGTVNKNGHIRYVSVNRILLDQVRHLCMSAGVRTGNMFATEIASNFNGAEYHHTLYAFVCTNVDDCQRIGSHTKFYNERWQRKSDGKRNRICPVYPYEQRRREYEEGIIFSEVRSIERESVHVPVYDLSVEETHNFVSDGVLVCNSNIEHQAIEWVTDTLFPWSRRLETEADVKLFGRTNRGVMFTKLNLASLLRGDTAARTQHYKDLFDRGVFSVNDIRELEDFNPIGSDGDKRFVPINFTTLELAGEPVENTPVPDDMPQPPDTPPQIPSDFNQEEELKARNAYRPIFREALGRIIRRENHRFADADKKLTENPDSGGEWLDAFLDGHRQYVREALRIPAESLSSLIAEPTPETLASVLIMTDIYTSKHCSRLKEKRNEEADAELLAEHFVNQVILATKLAR